MNALTEFLLDTALRGAGVLSLALMLGVLLHRVAAARRYAVWTAALVLLAVLPLAMQMLPGWHVLPKEHAAPLWELPQPEMPVISTEEPFPAESIAPSKIEPVADLKPVLAPEPVLAAKPAFSWKPRWEHLPLFWIVVAAGMFLRLFISAWRLRRLETTLPEGECAALAPISRELGLSRAPKLLIGAADAVPMVWGVWRARLLLPRGFETWSAEKLRGVLHHELAHLRRRDPLMLWLARAVKALHWFNPLAWLTLRALRADQERACDDSVLRAGVLPSDYAQHLLDLSRHSRAAPGLALCALTMTRCAPEESRVKAILDPKRPREPLTARWLFALLFVALLFLLPAAMLRAIEAPKLRGRILDRHGRVLAETTQEKMRVYPLRTLAAHLVGYVGKTKSDDPTPQGRLGLEKKHEATLRSGEDVKLSLDMRIQFLARRAMKEGGIERGAVVVLDPRTGEILASVSLPDYDPNLFVPGISHESWDQLSKDAGHPLLNRCLTGQYTPGSSYKPLISLAAAVAGKWGRQLECTGSVTYGSRSMACWKQRRDGKGHGVLDQAGALEQSCSCYFYRLGNETGIDEIAKTGALIGFCQRYGISDDENAGVLPGPAWLAETQPQSKWTAVHTANAAIGQGYVLVTPLQMAVLAATVANGGGVPEPALTPQNGEMIWRADLSAGKGLSDGIAATREGMRRVVHGENGSGQAARSEKVIIAGKTGTAQSLRRVDNQTIKDNNAWFIGFAPYDKPTLAFAVLKQGGTSGGADCAPVAKRIVEEALDLPADGSGEVKGPEEERKVQGVNIPQGSLEHGSKLTMSSPTYGASLDLGPPLWSKLPGLDEVPEVLRATVTNDGREMVPMSIQMPAPVVWRNREAFRPNAADPDDPLRLQDRIQGLDRTLVR